MNRSMYAVLLQSVRFLLKFPFQAKGLFAIGFFMTSLVFAEGQLCRYFFKAPGPMTDMQKLNSTFLTGTQRILRITPEASYNEQWLVKFLKSRLEEEALPVISLVVIPDRPGVLQEEVWRDLEPDVSVEVLRQQSISESFDRTSLTKPTVLIVRAEDAQQALLECLRRLQSNNRWPLDGIYIQEKPSVRAFFSQNILDRILANSQAILLGVTSGSPRALQNTFPFYEKAFVMGEVLGFSQVTITHTRSYSYEESQQLAFEQGIFSTAQLREWDRPYGVPLNLASAYRNSGWRTTKDFLSIPQKENAQPDSIKTLEEAKPEVHEQGFWMPKQYILWPDRPVDLPANPPETYANSGWKGWEDFLGQSRWMTYEEAQKAVFEAGIDGWEALRQWRGRPHRLPLYPNEIYKEEWTSSRDFFNNPKIRMSPRSIKIFAYLDGERVASHWAQQNGITEMSLRAYQARKDRPQGLPYDPPRYYKNKGWVDWPTFLGLNPKSVNAISESLPHDQNVRQ